MQKITIWEAKPGMITELPIVSPLNGQLLVASGTPLQEKILQKLVDYGVQEIFVLDRFTLHLTPLEHMRSSLKNSYLKLLYQYASEEKEGNLCDEMIEITKTVKKLIDQICDSDTNLGFALQMKLLSEETLFGHAVLTSLFSGLVAGHLRMDSQDIFSVMTAGLLHNVGALEMPHLIKKHNQLSGHELSLWQEHPFYGYYIVQQEGASQDVADLLLAHHERWSGGGYPKGLTQTGIPLGSRIISVCSTVAEQLLFEHQQPFTALECIYAASDIYFDKAVVDAFIESVCLYPIGSLVRLTTGEAGIVTNIRQNSGARPIVNVFYNRFNKPLASPRIVDLAKERTIFIQELLSQ